MTRDRTLQHTPTPMMAVVALVLLASPLLVRILGLVLTTWLGSEVGPSL